MDYKLNREQGSSENLIRFVTDRPGHDLRYAVDISKIKREFGWTPSIPFEEGLKFTINWCLKNGNWSKN